MKKQLFSMIETIVVIAIVCSLFSVLFSAIKSSKDIAFKATCMSNISQIRNHAELYRKDSNNLPYSETWMTDFSWAQNYISEGSLDIFNCPGDEQSTELTTYEMLKFNTSYYYIPSSKQLEDNLADGLNFGIDATLLAKLQASQDAVIYDRSPAHHNGSVNIAFLFKSDDPNFQGDGNSGTITSLNDPDNSELLALLDDGTIELPDVEVADEPVADEPETVDEPEDAVEYTIVASAGTGGSISPAGSSTFDAGDNQTYVITPDIGSSSSSSKTKSNNGHGNNEDGVDSSNPGNSKKGEDSDPNVDDESKSNGSSSSESSSSTTSYAILDVLVNGVSVGAVSSYTFSDINENHTISATFIEITEEDEDTTVAGKSNNGHGNNEDGVDSSNPGKSKQGEDSDPSVDDESKGGSSSDSDTSDDSSTSGDSSSSNGNGKAKGKKK
ncbi:MAG: type II secretion system GspH family protein [Lentisphaeraceae bacterium]|nr:type II secretion system GspH family protein [Lentisphaeraceae bacterium]